MESSPTARIAALVEAEPVLALRGALIAIVDRAEIDSRELRLPADLARARLAAGVPLLDRLELPIPAAASTLVERLTVAMLADPAARQPAEAMLAALRGHRLHAEQLVGEAVVAHEDHLSALAGSAGVPPPVVASVADLAARAFLSVMAVRLRPALALASWDRGYCPICGGRPLFAERVPVDSPLPRTGEGETLGRLRCSRCATSWAHSLLRCPDCQAGRLAMLDTSDLSELGGWTLAGCDACRGYLKVAPTPRSERLAELLADDLATWQLDRLALGRGLARQSGTGYRLEHGDVPGEEHDDD